jgi:adenylate cyclase
MKIFQALKIQLIAIASVLLVLFFTRWLAPDTFDTYEARTYDWRVSSRADKAPQSIKEVTIIDIDDRTIDNLGSFYRWPKEYWVRTLDYVNSGNPKAMVIDVIFDQNRINPQEDEEFINGISATKRLYNALYFDRADSLTFRPAMLHEPDGLDWRKIILPFPQQILAQYPPQERLENKFVELINAGLSAGHANFIPDEDGVARWSHLGVKFNEKFYPTLSFRPVYDIIDGQDIRYSATENLITVEGNEKSIHIPVDEKGRFLIRYQGGYKVFRTISFYDVFDRRLQAETFSDKIVLFGTSLAGLYDLRVTPVNSRFPGVAIHANLIYSLLNEDFFTQASDMLWLGIVVAFGFLFAFLFGKMRPVFAIVLGIFLVLAYLVSAFLVFEFEGLWLPIIEPMLTVLVAFGTTFSYRYITEEKNKRFLRGVFSHYVTPSVVNELLANPDKIKLGGERKNCTVMFSDVAGFTSISEKMAPEDLVHLLNEYLTQMTNIVFKYDGMLDKYEGDAIMAVFGAPVELKNAALNGVLCALEMQRELVNLRAKWKAENQPELRARIGLNSGPMVVGNMGSESRFDYTVMGDSVNLGARLESANKQYGTYIMLGENTYEEVKSEILCRKLDMIRVKGKQEPVSVFEAIAELAVASDKERQLVEMFASGYAAYLMQKWDRAEAQFKAILEIYPDDAPTLTYIKRIQVIKTEAPLPDWDGVFDMLTK